MCKTVGCRGLPPQKLGEARDAGGTAGLGRPPAASPISGSVSELLSAGFWGLPLKDMRSFHEVCPMRTDSAAHPCDLQPRTLSFHDAF